MKVKQKRRVPFTFTNPGRHSRSSELRHKRPCGIKRRQILRLPSSNVPIRSAPPTSGRRRRLQTRPRACEAAAGQMWPRPSGAPSPVLLMSAQAGGVARISQREGTRESVGTSPCLMTARMRETAARSLRLLMASESREELNSARNILGRRREHRTSRLLRFEIRKVSHDSLLASAVTNLSTRGQHHQEDRLFGGFGQIISYF